MFPNVELVELSEQLVKTLDTVAVIWNLGEVGTYCQSVTKGDSPGCQQEDIGVGNSYDFHRGLGRGGSCASFRGVCGLEGSRARSAKRPSQRNRSQAVPPKHSSKGRVT